MRYRLTPKWLSVLMIGIGVMVALGDENTGALSPAAEKQRGVCWVGGPRVVTEEAFLPLLRNNVEWINQTPFGWQRHTDSPEIHLNTGKHSWWGETDEGIRATTALAKKKGIKSVLKPHIWITRPGAGKWRAQIAMKTEADWQQWFHNYRKFILHYARLAEECGIEILCIGTELHGTVESREADWRRLIADIRQVYHGQLTYAANWYKEFEQIRFWDELDFIGIQAYFPVSESDQPTVEELEAGWKPYLKSIERVQSWFNKPVIFTEIGYKSKTGTAGKPWEWIRPFNGSPTPEELQTQVNCYEAFFKTFWHRDWFAGVYFWKWFPNSTRTRGGQNHGFTPQDKPAEQVMARWFSH